MHTTYVINDEAIPLGISSIEFDAPGRKSGCNKPSRARNDNADYGAGVTVVRWQARTWNACEFDDGSRE